MASAWSEASRRKAERLVSHVVGNDGKALRMPSRRRDLAEVHGCQHACCRVGFDMLTVAAGPGSPGRLIHWSWGVTMSRMLRITAAVIGLLTVFAVAGPAHAAERVSFTIDEQIDFEAGVFTFTATEPFCPSGTFEDDVSVAAFAHSEQARSGGFNLLIRATFTCADGSGTFDMLKHVFITFTGEDSSTSTGPVQILGGTGDFDGIVGHGVDIGTAAGGTGVGEITGWVLEQP
jgi:hypothetical protein